MKYNEIYAIKKNKRKPDKNADNIDVLFSTFSSFFVVALDMIADMMPARRPIDVARIMVFDIAAFPARIMEFEVNMLTSRRLFCIRTKRISLIE